MTGQHGNAAREIFDKCPGGFRYHTAQVAHDGAGRSEAKRHFAQPRKNGIGPLRGYLSGAEPPLAPAGERHQQGSPAVLACRIDVQWPSVICCQRRSQCKG